MLTPDQLFERLLLFKKLISYAEAYSEIIGPKPKFWYRYVHNDEVIAKALESSIRVEQGLPIQLDALIVDKQTRRPGDGHYKGKQYTRDQWIKVFGAWPFEETA